MKKVVFLLALMLCWATVPSSWSWAAPSPAAAAEPAAAMASTPEAEQGQPTEEPACPATFGPIITDTAVPIDKGAFAIQPTFGTSFVVNAFTPSWRRATAGGNFSSFSMDWKLTYGLWDNLEVFVVVPFVQNWAHDVNEPGPQGNRAASSASLGDINLTWKYQLVAETATIPTVTALFATDFPTGRYRHPNPGKLGTDVIGGGAYAFTVGANLSKCLKPLVLYANVWYTLQTAYTTRGEDENGASINVRQYPRDFVTVNVAAEYIITPKWIALLEAVSTWDGGRLFGQKANVQPAALLSVVPGIEYMATEKLAFALGVQVDVAGKNTEAAVTPLFSLVYQF